jgi:hypothetical protein
VLVDPDLQDPPHAVRMSVRLEDITIFNAIELHLPSIPGQDLVRQPITVKAAEKLVSFVGLTSKPALSHFDIFASTIRTDTSLRATHCLQHLSNSFDCRIPQISEDRLPSTCPSDPRNKIETRKNSLAYWNLPCGSIEMCPA